MRYPSRGPHAGSAVPGTNETVSTPVAPIPASESVDSALDEVEVTAAEVVEPAPTERATAEPKATERASTVPDASPVGGRRSMPGWLRELILVAAVYFSYSLTRNLIPNQEATAQRNARSILELEQSLGLDIELGINLWGADRPWLIIPVNYYYATLHLSFTLFVMIWLYRRRNAVYARLRCWLLTMTMMALASYWLYPLAPPRLMPGRSYIDTVKEYVLWGFTPSEDMQSVSNQYAAMPSMHVGWSLWVGVALFCYGRTRITRAIGIAYPVTTVFVVVVTANHFILDAVAAVVFFAVAIVLVDRFGKLTSRSHLRVIRSQVA